jgi:uncharacterized surface protein with fasciclin (FAS1) repeats
MYRECRSIADVAAPGQSIADRCGKHHLDQMETALCSALFAAAFVFTATSSATGWSAHIADVCMREGVRFLKPIGSIPMTTTLHDIVDTAVAAGSFKTLVAAVTAADLGATLKGAGPFTVFAPSDDAFAKLPAGTVEELVKPENKAKLAAILTYHVMAGKVMAADVSGKKLEPATVNGATLHVDGMSGVTINGAKVVTADIACTNGVIHVIDTVLMPKAA